MDTLINGPRGYYGHFALQMDIFINAFGILPSPEWILEEERRHWNLKVEKMVINLASQKIKEDFSFREELFYIISNKLYKCLRICILWFCLPSLVGWAFIDEIKFGFSDVSRACKAYLLGWHVLLGKVLHCFSLWEQGFSKLFYLPPPSLPFPPCNLGVGSLLLGLSWTPKK